MPVSAVRQFRAEGERPLKVPSPPASSTSCAIISDIFSTWPTMASSTASLAQLEPDAAPPVPGPPYCPDSHHSSGPHHAPGLPTPHPQYPARV